MGHDGQKLLYPGLRGSRNHNESRACR
jgi:hypothetical protein